MNIVDLTHLINESMPVFPGTEPPVLNKACTVEKNGFAEMKISMYSHTGTHMDAPAHMIMNGTTLDKMSIDRFIGKAVILDFTQTKSEFIGIEDIAIFEEKIKAAEFLIIKTGWSRYWGTNKYFKNFPALDDEAAKWLCRFKLKGIGVDAISIDSIKSESFSVHKILMPQNILIIENLANLDSVRSDFFILSVMPLKTVDADGSPLRAVAIENIN